MIDSLFHLDARVCDVDDAIEERIELKINHHDLQLFDEEDRRVYRVKERCAVPHEHVEDHVWHVVLVQKLVCSMLHKDPHAVKHVCVVQTVGVWVHPRHGDKRVPEEKAVATRHEPCGLSSGKRLVVVGGKVREAEVFKEVEEVTGEITQPREERRG